ncbi:MFS transporter [Sulfolobus acidocaldarius]|uniref:Sugar transporter n=1 Tax=Sulfolobus acidocaldarius TaxID=2285 RepID=A0A0U2WUI7_9CREN|nr:MFS transporter [Sulfolobus acidocaldarius]ALU29746.1 sugar transporter [Sulfolobus acidocaldarius]ALU32483.1 sugar transporter [Sulfolobus acidocaldarius]
MDKTYIQKSTPKRSTYTVLSAMGYFLDGYDLSVISVFTFILQTYKIFPYDSFTLGWVSGSALLGAMVGAILFGHYSDRIGRRYLYVFDLIFFVVFAVLSALSTNLIQMIIFRFFIGWGVGADYALSPVYASEMYPNMERGKGYGWVWSFWSIGAAVAFSVGYLFYLIDPITAWRWALGLGAIPAIITILLRTNLPESTRWNIAQKGEKAIEEARLLRRETGMTDEDINNLIKEKQKYEKISAGSITALFKGEWAKRTAVVWTQWILYDIGAYGFGLYSPSILSLLGIKGALAILFSALLYVPGFLGALGAAYLNDTVGRRILQLLGFGFATLGMIFVALGATIGGLFAIALGIIGLIFYYGMGNLGPGNTMGLYAIELFPTKLRSVSMGSATAITRFVSFLSAFEFPFIVSSFGKLPFFELLVIVSAAAFVFTLIFTPETKGLSLEQISTYKYRRGKLIPDDRKE